ncbi:MAG: hypothetical protein P8M22_01440 [Phycisphaerales bacterium]|nr:hypothetical protein [Phycisphaerales bacterium]
MTRRTIISMLFHIAGSLFLLSAVILLVGWIIGVIFSDQWTWTQWLSWIPELILVPAGLCWLAGISLVQRWRRHWQPAVLMLVLGPALFLFMNWKPSGPTDIGSPEGITITQWTLGTILENEDEFARPLIEINSDISILEGGRRVRWSKPIKEWLGSDHTPLSTGIFSIFTQLPVDTLRSIIWAEGIYAAKFVVSGPGFETTPLKILLIDLPSDPNRSRWDIAIRLKELLAKVSMEDVDLIIGDFNMPSNSAALASLFPGYKDAWAISGNGWGPTFPREWPIARLDHVLVGPTVEVTSIRTINPGLGRHSLQIIQVAGR